MDDHTDLQIARRMRAAQLARRLANPQSDTALADYYAQFKAPGVVRDLIRDSVIRQYAASQVAGVPHHQLFSEGKLQRFESVVLAVANQLLTMASVREWTSTNGITIDAACRELLGELISLNRPFDRLNLTQPLLFVSMMTHQLEGMREQEDYEIQLFIELEDRVLEAQWRQVQKVCAVFLELLDQEEEQQA